MSSSEFGDVFGFGMALGSPSFNAQGKRISMICLL